MEQIRYQRISKDKNGNKYEKVLPGDKVLYDGRLYLVNNAVGMSTNGVQIAELIWEEELNANKKRMIISIESNKLKIIEDNEEKAYWDLRNMWNHLSSEEADKVMSDFGFIKI